MRQFKRFQKKPILIFILIIILIGVVGCNKDPIVIPEEIDYDFPEEFKGILDNKKVYITSLGQSIDIENLLVYVDYLNDFEYIYEEYLEADEVTDGSVVFAVVGCSIKALADAGIGVEDEIERAEGFTSAARENKIILISWHLGGMARRGSTSDKIIEIMFSDSNLDIFVENGNSDYYLSNIVSEYDRKAYQIPAISSLKEPLKLLLGE